MSENEQQEPDQDFCMYSLRHRLDLVPAVTTIDCGPVGPVRACQWCADFYRRMSS